MTILIPDEDTVCLRIFRWYKMQDCFRGREVPPPGDGASFTRMNISIPTLKAWLVHKLRSTKQANLYESFTAIKHKALQGSPGICEQKLNCLEGRRTCRVV